MSTATNPFKMKAKSSEGGNYTPPPAGNHAGILVAIVDLGTHWVDGYQGAAGSDQRLVYLVWELPELAREDGAGNHLIGQRYKLSSHQKAGLRQALESWRGSGFGDGEDIDLPGWLGKTCLVNVKHETSAQKKVYAKLDKITPLPAMMARNMPQPTYPLLCWSFASDEELPDVSHLPYVFGTPVREKIEASREWRAAHGGRAGSSARPDPNRPLTDDGEDAPQEEPPF